MLDQTRKKTTNPVNVEVKIKMLFQRANPQKGINPE